jgi:hypothetical protein
MSGLSSGVHIALIVIIITCAVIIEVLVSFEIVVSPLAKASNCGNVAKQYSDLSREINAVILSLSEIEDTEEISGELFQQILYYSSREQLIIQSEPLVFLGGKLTGRQLKSYNIEKYKDGGILDRLHESSMDDEDKERIAAMLANSQFMV